MELPLVSVIIPNFNNGQYISSAVDCVLSQTYPNVETIVVDDGSTDDSRSKLREFGNSIKVIEQSNQGVSAARNRGVEASKGDVLAFLDADDRWASEKLTQQVEKLYSDPEIGLVHCAVEDIDDTGRVIEVHRGGLEGWVADDLLKYQRPVILGGGSATIVSRVAVDTVGGFNESMRVGEDWEFYYRVARRFKVGFVNEVLVSYRRHSANSYFGNSKAVKRMKKDMLFAYDRIFNEDDQLTPIRAACYGRIHSVIAASCFHSKMYPSALRHVVLSLSYSPGNLFYFLGLPLRKIRKLP
jgi:glycosyltransferase involved in cell wall biosynthesis